MFKHTNQISVFYLFCIPYSYAQPNYFSSTCYHPPTGASELAHNLASVLHRGGHEGDIMRWGSLRYSWMGLDPHRSSNEATAMRNSTCLQLSVTGQLMRLEIHSPGPQSSFRLILPEYRHSSRIPIYTFSLSLSR